MGHNVFRLCKEENPRSHIVTVISPWQLRKGFLSCSIVNLGSYVTYLYIRGNLYLCCQPKKQHYAYRSVGDLKGTGTSPDNILKFHASVNKTVMKNTRRIVEKQCLC